MSSSNGPVQGIPLLPAVFRIISRRFAPSTASCVMCFLCPSVNSPFAYPHLDPVLYHACLYSVLECVQLIPILEPHLVVLFATVFYQCLWNLIASSQPSFCLHVTSSKILSQTPQFMQSPQSDTIILLTQFHCSMTPWLFFLWHIIKIPGLVSKHNTLANVE